MTSPGPGPSPGPGGGSRFPPGGWGGLIEPGTPCKTIYIEEDPEWTSIFPYWPNKKVRIICVEGTDPNV